MIRIPTNENSNNNLKRFNYTFSHSRVFTVEHKMFMAYLSFAIIKLSSRTFILVLIKQTANHKTVYSILFSVYFDWIIN